MIDQILIDFPGGAHGHFLEFLLNKFYYLEDWDAPFTAIGTSHNKAYIPYDKKFFANHFAREDFIDRASFTEYLDNSQDVIVITIESDDLLQLALNSMYRAGDTRIDIDNLEKDTYNKLIKFEFYHSLIDNLNRSYNLQCSESNPDVPRYVLREFFKFGFREDDSNGFIISQKGTEKYLKDKNVYNFPYKSFFDIELLATEISKVAEHYRLTLTIDREYLKLIHDKFLNSIVGLTDKLICDTVIDNVVNNQANDVPKLNLLQESYINGKLEKLYDKEMPFLMDDYFTNTQQILEYLK